MPRLVNEETGERADLCVGCWGESSAFESVAEKLGCETDELVTDYGHEGYVKGEDSCDACGAPLTDQDN